MLRMYVPSLYMTLNPIPFFFIRVLYTMYSNEDNGYYSKQRVPEWLSFRQNWVPPLPRKRVCLPLGPKGVEEKHSLASEGMWGPNSDDWNESQALCRYSVPQFIHSLTLTVQSNYSQRVPLMRPSSQFFTPYAAVT
jgi:hypothetical protein